MLSALMLAWYDENGRTLPFRGTKDPYRIWVSEIMLQQTRTETVGAYYERFLRRFPDVFALADAPEEDVLKCWEGLGYYSRARNLHKAAKKVVKQYGGRFPADVTALRALPGVGDYTAAAVASIAFDLPAPAMDGNLTRVLSRFHGVRVDVGVPSVQRRLAALGQRDMPPVRCGDFNQALMDLGATVCVPGTPDCPRCPLRTLCDACRAGDAEDLPVKAAAKPPVNVSLAVHLITCHGRIWMTQRKEALLNHLWVYALSADEPDGDPEQPLKALGIQAERQADLGPARHVFTHRVWNMRLFHDRAGSAACRSGRFVTLSEMQALPMPTAMRAAREAAFRLLTPQVILSDDASLPLLAAAYADSWKDSHAGICAPAFLADHTAAHMEAVLRGQRDAGRDVYGLWIAGEAAGVLVIDRQENELVSLYVHPDCQGLGIGRAAVAYAVSVLDGRRDMRVTVLCGNERARALYQSSGFDSVAEIRVLDPQRSIREEVRIRPGRETDGLARAAQENADGG